MSFETINSNSFYDNDFLRIECGKLKSDNTISHSNTILLGCVKSGSGIIELENISYQISENDVIFISPNNNYIVYGNQVDIDAISIDISNPFSISRDRYILEILTLVPTKQFTDSALIPKADKINEELRNNINSVIQAKNSPNVYYSIFITGQLYNIAYLLMSSKYVKMELPVSQSRKLSTLNTVTEYLNKHFTEDVSLAVLSEKLGISKYYISHLFQELLNKSYVDYTNELRLAKAAEMLIKSDIPVSEIAYKSGFGNLSNFNRLFRLSYNSTPTDYRRNNSRNKTN